MNPNPQILSGDNHNLKSLEHGLQLASTTKLDERTYYIRTLFRYHSHAKSNLTLPNAISTTVRRAARRNCIARMFACYLLLVAKNRLVGWRLRGGPFGGNDVEK